MKILRLLTLALLLSYTTNAQWIRTGGPEGISISSLLSVNDLIYAGTETDGVYASSDDGVSWFPLNSGIETESISALAAVSGYLFAATFGHGVYRSTDNGQTWLAPVSGGNLFLVGLVAKDTFLFAATGSDGVYRSSDYGETWVQLFGIYGMLAMGTSNDKVIASTYGYTFATTDNGDNWYEITSLEGAAPWSFYTDGDLILAGGVNEIYRSTNQGSSFITIPVNFSFGVVNIYSITKLGSDFYMGTSYDGVYKSTDNGSTWTAANLGMGPKDIRAVTSTGSGSLVAGSHYVGVFRSTDMAAEWNKSMTGFPAGSSVPALLSAEAALFAGTRDGIYRSTDNGTNWEEIQGDNDTVNYSLVRGLCELNRNIYAATNLKFHSTVYKSTDNGSTWYRSGTGLPADLTFIDALAASGNNIVAGTSEGVFYSDDEGLTWHQANAPVQFIEDVAASGNTAYAIVSGVGVYRSLDSGINWSIALPSTIDYVTMAAFENYAYAGSFFQGLRYSSNFGSGWTSSSGFPSETSIFAIGPVGDGMVLAATDVDPSHIYASYDNGGYFSPFSEGLGPWAIAQSFAVNDLYMYAGTAYNGIWRRLRPGVPVELVSFSAEAANNKVKLTWQTATETNNSGFEIQRKGNKADWIKIGFLEGYGTASDSHEYSFTDSDILTGTYQYRLKQIDFDGSFKYSDIVEINMAAPLQLSLEQNYPNPFNPTTRINYSIPSTQKVVLKVYDVLGRDVATLVNRQQSAGNYTVDFDASGFASGIYFYRLQAKPESRQAGDPSTGSGQDLVQMKKMILMK